MDLLIPSLFTMSIKFSFALIFSSIWPFWYTSHNMLDFLLLILFSILLTASPALSGLFILFWCFFKTFVNCFFHHYQIFYLLKIPSMIFLTLLFVSSVSKLFSEKKKSTKISKHTSSTYWPHSLFFKKRSAVPKIRLNHAF